MKTQLRAVRKFIDQWGQHRPGELIVSETEERTRNLLENGLCVIANEDSIGPAETKPAGPSEVKVAEATGAAKGVVIAATDPAIVGTVTGETSATVLADPKCPSHGQKETDAGKSSGAQTDGQSTDLASSVAPGSDTPSSASQEDQASPPSSSTSPDEPAAGSSQ